ncbi:nucleotide-sugar transporter [Melanogaster broomeanus]|nr:nucleotide-sugar transporter [Melanogaster broomeanus]
MSQLPIPSRKDSVIFVAKDNDEDIEYEEIELGLLPADAPPTPSLCGVPLKYISLITLAVQNSLLTIIMHYSRVSIPPSQSYSAPAAVLLNELLKGSISLAIAFTQIDRSTSYTSDTPQPGLTTGRFWHPSKVLLRIRRLGREVFSSDCWKLSIPAILYVIQNNLQYVAATNLEAATFQVSYQMKILTTAAFSVLLLRKQLSASQWLALFFLAIGVGIVQIQTGASDTAKAASSLLFRGTSMNALKGFLAVVAACFTSGLAGVYFEMVLKNSQSDLWIRNVQLSAFSLLPALVPILLTQPSESGLISSLFKNFGAWAWATVAIQVLGGLVTAMAFATSLSIVISFLASVALFDFQITFTFVLGSVVVLIATWLYNQPGRSSSVSRLNLAKT